jgi:hypothetical protein
MAHTTVVAVEDAEVPNESPLALARAVREVQSNFPSSEAALRGPAYGLHWIATDSDNLDLCGMS